MTELIDIQENELWHEMPEVFDALLLDHTTKKNIMWCTHDYSSLGEGFCSNDEIKPGCITGEHGDIIKPRVLKSKEQQTDRSKDMAEVFTPSWVCNAQNNLVDEAWFGRKPVFNVENEETHTWKATKGKIEFPEGRTWKDYVRATRMEMTCGEAPYLVSRYDTTTGNIIPLHERIGFLDRKLRIVSENTDKSGEWLDWAHKALMNIYGFEWQGDSLLLAREALLMTFIEYYKAKFGKMPMEKSIQFSAYIISWNLWQMDGLKGVVPDSCHPEVEMVDLFSGEGREKPCQGCLDGGYYHHNGIYCMIRDWGVKDPLTGENNKKIRFIDLIKK